MNGMKISLGVLALLAIGMVGCGKNETNNAPVTGTSNEPVASANNQPTVEANNGPAVATNTAPETNTPDVNAPLATNAPADPKKPKGKAMNPVKDLPPVPDPSAPGKDGWTKVQLEAKKLVQTVDTNMKAVKNMKIVLHEDFNLAGQRGFFEDSFYVADQNRFHLNYASTYKVNTLVDSFIVTKIDGQYKTLVGKNYQPGRVEPNKDLLSGWLLDSTHYMADSVGTKKMPFTELVTAAQKAKWKIMVESKQYDKRTFQRVVMESPSEPKKRFELMVEPNMKLPVQFNTVAYNKKKTSTALFVAWLQSDKPFTDAELSPKVPTKEVKTMTAEEAKKQGIKLPGGN